MQTLPTETIDLIFRKLSPKDVIQFAQTNKYWNEISTKDQIWSFFIKKFNVINFVPSHTSSYFQFSVWWKKFKYCVEEYPKISEAFALLSEWLRKNNLENMLYPGTTNEVLNSLALKKNFTWPTDLYCWYLMTNGQVWVDAGLFGSYSFYEFQANYKFISAENASVLIGDGSFLPFSVSDFSSQPTVHMIALKDGANYKKNNVVIEADDFSIIPVAESFTAFIRHYVKQLLKGIYQLTEDGIWLYPAKNIPTEVTHGVKIEASPLFIPKQSHRGRSLFAYHIKISMDKDLPRDKYECQLVSRHWDIQSEGRVEAVDGPGVIGLFPVIKPGSEFSYQSCCPFRGINATMGGWFRMRKLNGETFEAIVPTFNMSRPELIIDDNNLFSEEMKRNPE